MEMFISSEPGQPGVRMITKSVLSYTLSTERETRQINMYGYLTYVLNHAVTLLFVPLFSAAP